MLKDFTLILLTTISSFGFSVDLYPPDSSLTIIQKAEIKLTLADGKQYYGEDNFKLALIKFREVLTIDKYNADANYWVAECHLVLKNYETALKYGKKSLHVNPKVSKDLYYVLGHAYHRLGQLDEAVKNYSKAKEIMSKSRSKDYRLQQKLEECERARELLSNPRDIIIKNLGNQVNSKNDDYAPILTNSGKTIYFSARKAENEGGGFSSGDNKYFSDIFMSHWDESENIWSKASNNKQALKKLNSAGFDDIAFITHDGKTLYFCINTEGVENSKISTQSTDIFYSNLKDNIWSSPKPISRAINSIYFEASPTFTKDGNTMYFVSERIGGYGKADIWVSYKVNKKWSKPVNLGEKINSTQQETTVSVSPNGEYLFFSSEGHKGMGGYDVYVTKMINNEWSIPINLGYPINSVSDETHFNYYPELNKALYSKASDKKNGGIGRRDIFEIDMSNFNLDTLFSTQ